MTCCKNQQNKPQVPLAVVFVIAALIVALALALAGCTAPNKPDKPQPKDTNNGVPVEVNSDEEYTKIVLGALTDKQGVPLFIYFCSPTLSDCKAETPIIEKLALQYNHQVKFIIVDVEKWPEALDRMQITRLPHMIYLDSATGHGDKTSGFLDETQLNDFIKQAQNTKSTSELLK